MTLITRIIKGDKSWMFGDKRSTLKTHKGNRVEFIYSDKASKLLVGENYCIGLQGDAKTQNHNYKSQLESFVSQNNRINSAVEFDPLNEIIRLNKSDELGDGLNLTILCEIQQTSKSLYISSSKPIKKIVHFDKVKSEIRFNNETTQNSQLFTQAMIYLKCYYRDNGLFSGFKLTNIWDFDEATYEPAFKYMYKRFSESNNTSNLFIGGETDIYKI